MTNTATQAEADDNLRVKRAEEALRSYRDAENTARRELAMAVESTKRAKDKYEALFEECQNRAVARRKAGLIEVIAGY